MCLPLISDKVNQRAGISLGAEGTAVVWSMVGVVIGAVVRYIIALIVGGYRHDLVE